MNSILYKKLFTAFKWFINLALAFQIGAAILAFVAIIFTVSGEGKLISAWDVFITTKNTSIADQQLVLNKGTIQFTSSSIGYYILKIIDSLFVFLVIILVTVLLKKIIYSIQKQNPFTTENAGRIRKIAFLLMAITPYSLIKSLIYRSYIVNNVIIEGKEYTELFSFSPNNLADNIWLVWDINFQALIAGVILIIISEVFGLGVLIKAENESIV
jgi:hypothetical protein